MMPATSDEGSAFEHAAWCVDATPAEIAQQLADRLDRAVDDGSIAVLLAPAARLDAVASLGVSAEVELAPLEEHARNPARIVAFWCDVLERADGRHVVGISESVHAGRSADAQAEAVRAERLMNRAIAPQARLLLLCCVDQRTLRPATSARTAQAHSCSVLHLSDEVPAPARTLLPSDAMAPLPEPPSFASRLQLNDVDQLAELRDHVLTMASQASMHLDRAYDLALAASELAANSLRHGGGRSDVQLWADDAGATCDVRDSGELDPLEGLLLPDATKPDGRGLWLVHQLVDLVQQRTTVDGSVVRIRLER